MRYAVLVIGVLGVASAALFARYGLEAGASAVALSGWRLTVAAGGLILFRLYRPAPRRLDRSRYWMAGVAGLFLALHFVTWIASLSYVSVARSTLLVSTAPLWAGLAGLFVPSLRPRPIFWAGLLVALAGTALVTSQEPVARVLQSPAWLGDVLAVIGAICLVPYLLLSQRLQKEIDTLSTVTWIYSFAAGGILVGLLIAGLAQPPTSGAIWISVLGMAFFAQLIGHSSLNYALKSFTAAQVATATLLEPVFAGVLAWILLGERISFLQGLGAAVLLAGVGLSLCGPREPIVADPEL